MLTHSKRVGAPCLLLARFVCLMNPRKGVFDSVLEMASPWLDGSFQYEWLAGKALLW